MRFWQLSTLCWIISVGSIAPLFAGGVAEQLHKGVRAYQKQDYAGASNAFAAALRKEPGSAEAAFDLGASEYHEQKYTQALKHFRQAETANTASSSLQARANYDQGKSLARLGDAVEARSPQSAIGYYRKGVESFQRSLQVDPSMRSAGYNIEVLRRRIKKLEQKLKRQAQGSPPKSPAGSKPNNGRSKAGAAKNSGKNTSQGSQKERTGSNGAQNQRKPAATRNTPAAPSSSASASSKTQAGTGNLSARQILNAELNHRRIINIQRQQVSPHVAQDW